MSGEFLDGFYRIKRGDVVFRALVTGPAKGAHFRELKRRGDRIRTESDYFLKAAVSCIAYFVEKGRFDIITTPPDSGDGESFAGGIAKRISEKSGVDFVKVFEDHGRGKRKHLGAKFQPIRFSLAKNIRDCRVLVFDDIAHTRFTMAGSIAALKAFDNEVEGVVLCA